MGEGGVSGRRAYRQGDSTPSPFSEGGSLSPRRRSTARLLPRWACRGHGRGEVLAGRLLKTIKV
jgi:hypothetical protein